VRGVLVVALVTDLMDQAKVRGACPDTRFVRQVSPDALAGADVVVVDLARHGDAIATIRAELPTARIVGFGPHVDDDAAAAAVADGADAVLPRSRFFRDVAAAIAAT
jgi:hypothetical protein